MKQLRWQLPVLIAAFLAFTAASPTPSSRPEDLLKSAGFAEKRAETKEQKQQLQKLPDGKMCVVRENGAKHYVYADKTHNEVYVGNEDKHRKFRDGLKRIGGADAVRQTMYDGRGNPVQVNTFSGFGPWPD
jgi:hypothetical protein